ncbi:MAG: lipopolysaccharide heptosyltransferase II [Deltaproteobacteria bacterium]|nr:lipopolysaccharide heptosyltransferase II [Deltaproteobacteria bacterium]
MSAGAGGAAGRPVVPPRRVLVKEPNWLGDLVISLPALHAVRRAYPAAELAVLVRQELAGFFDGLRWVDRVIAYRVRRGLAGIADRRRVVSAIRAGGFDLAVVFPKSFEAALWVKLGGVPRRAGLAVQARGALLTHRTAPARALENAHQANDYLQMLRDTLAIEGSAADVLLEVGAQRQAMMREWLTARRRRPRLPLVALAAAAAYGPAKEWPAERYAALVDRLAGRCECVLVGAPGERGRCERIVTASRAGALVAAGATDVGDLVALLSLCAGFAGNDSGAMHVAGALGIPTVGIFGSTWPERTGPLGPRTRVLYRKVPCSPCFDRACRFGHYECLKAISVAEVGDALAGLGTFGG